MYVSFSDDTILDSVAPLEGFLKDWTRVTVPRNAQPAFTNVPSKEGPLEEAAPTEDGVEELVPVRGPLEELTTSQVPCDEQTKVETSLNQFLVGRKCCIPPSWLPLLDNPSGPQ